MIMRRLKQVLMTIIGLYFVCFILTKTLLSTKTTHNLQTKKRKENVNITFTKGKTETFDQSSKIINSSTVSFHIKRLDKNIIEGGQCSLLELDKCTDQQLKEMLEELEDKIKVDAPTPSGFIEVRKKIKSMMKFNDYDMTYEEMKNRVPKKQFLENNIRSRKMLEKRANNSPANSSLRRFVDIQKKRTQLIRTTCDDLVKNGTKLPSNSFFNIIVDRPDYITFCPIYKAASTSWSIILLKMRGLKRKAVIRNIQKVINLTFEKLSNSVAPSMTKETTRFLIVRHPFQRLISCYRDKFEGARKDFYYVRFGEIMVKTFRPKPKYVTNKEQHSMLRAVRKHVEKKTHLDFERNFYTSPIGPTFEEFIKFIVSIVHDDDHWAPFYKYCALCHMDYDVVLKFETLETDSSSFLEYLNHTEIKGDHWENPTSNGVTTEEVVCKYFSTIDSELLTKLVKKYSWDFIFFDYSPEEYFKCTKTKEYSFSNL